MNKKKIAFSFSFLFLIIALSGCTELPDLDKPDYITVVVHCTAWVHANNGPLLGDLESGLVRLEIVKAGGERVSDLFTIKHGGTDELVGTFNVYNQQSIVCIGNVILESIPDYADTYTFNSGTYTLTWELIDSQGDFGDTIWITDARVDIFGNEK